MQTKKELEELKRLLDKKKIPYECETYSRRSLYIPNYIKRTFIVFVRNGLVLCQTHFDETPIRTIEHYGSLKPKQIYRIIKRGRKLWQK